MEQEIVCHDIEGAEEICIDFRNNIATYSEPEFRVNMFISEGFPRLLLEEFPRIVEGFPRSVEEFPRSEKGFPLEVSARPSDVSLGERSRRLLILGSTRDD